MRVLNEYPGSHHYIESWEPEPDLFCPNCGEQGKLWTAASGDHYVGPETLCTACSHTMRLLGGPGPVRSINTMGILKQLRSGVLLEPTTKAGG